jgi:hypothetical protein
MASRSSSLTTGGRSRAKRPPRDSAADAFDQATPQRDQHLEGLVLEVFTVEEVLQRRAGTGLAGFDHPVLDEPPEHASDGTPRLPSDARDLVTA